MKDNFGAQRLVSTLRHRDLLKFRNDIQRVDRTLRGRAVPFRDRLTDDPKKQIKSATYFRYWHMAAAFCAWFRSEEHSTIDPALAIKIEKKHGETKNTPESFSKEELIKLFGTPLYAGHLSYRRFRQPGSWQARAGHWWAPVLLLYTGLRAGELSQLRHEDFVFDDEIPHLKVRQEDASGQKVKSTKSKASVRDLPLHPNLLKLGLRQFVDGRRKQYPKDRVFREFRLGNDGRISDGMTRFWRDYLMHFGLWKTGRGTHVFRHTVAGCLRENGVTDEQIGSFLGHEGKPVTSGYGPRRKWPSPPSSITGSTWSRP
jgi:integrase